jgi:hypothetical protein
MCRWGLLRSFWSSRRPIAPATKRRYSAISPESDDRGAIMEMALFAGQGVDAIRDIPSAGELVARLWKDCLDAA